MIKKKESLNGFKAASIKKMPMCSKKDKTKVLSKGLKTVSHTNCIAKVQKIQKMDKLHISN